jgi:hypothetical protein
MKRNIVGDFAQTACHNGAGADHDDESREQSVVTLLMLYLLMMIDREEDF